MGVINEISQSLVSKKSPTGPTAPKPEHLIALATYLGVRWQGHIHFFDGLFGTWLLVSIEKHGPRRCHSSDGETCHVRTTEMMTGCSKLNLMAS